MAVAYPSWCAKAHDCTSVSHSGGDVRLSGDGFGADLDIASTCRGRVVRTPISAVTPQRGGALQDESICVCYPCRGMTDGCETHTLKRRQVEPQKD